MGRTYLDAIVDRHREVAAADSRVLDTLLEQCGSLPPTRGFRAALAAEDIPTAGANLNQIRILVTVNLVIGLVNAVVGSTGRYW